MIIIGYDLWQRKFHGDRSITGKTVRLSRQRTPRFPSSESCLRVFDSFPSPGASEEPNYNANATVDYWMPAIPGPARLKEPDWDLIGRLRAGVGIAGSSSELGALAGREALAEPAFAGLTPRCSPWPKK